MEVSLTIVLTFPLLLPVMSTQVTYHIRPTSESPCPYQDCLTLSEYAMETSRYTNSNNLTLVFLPGEHVLNTSIEFQFLDSLSLLGNQSSLPNITSKIICNYTSAFTLTNMTFVEMNALSLNKCGSQNSSEGYQLSLEQLSVQYINVTAVMNTVPTLAGLFLINFQLYNCHFYNNYLPIMLNNSRMHARDTTFLNNKGSFGGAMTLSGSVAILLGQNKFLSNKAVLGGGVFASNSSMVLVGPTVYVNNTAAYGGGINALNSTITFLSDDSDIHSPHSHRVFRNVAWLGGGVLLSNSILLQNEGLLKFSENVASNGGAVITHRSHVSLKGFTMFEHNSAVVVGGAVSVMSGTWSSAMVSFVNNYVLRLGGAVSVSNGTWSSVVTSFVRNSAKRGGGAIYAQDSKLNFGSLEDEGFAETSQKNTFSTHVHFLGNEAFDGGGGGIFLDESCTLNITGFGTYVRNIANTNGGMIFAQSKSNFALDGNNTFIGNQAKCGGAIAVQNFLTGSHSIALFSGNISFFSNVAEYGGGIFYRKSTVQVVGKVIYFNNTADHNGGGLYVQDSTLVTSGIGIYKNNTAVHHGGVIFVDSSSLIISGTSTYINNSAMKSNGGVILVSSSHIEFHGVVSYVNNKAGYDGGCIFLEGGSILNISGIGSYLDNSARRSGGAINAYMSHFLLNGKSLFTRNYAGNGGGIVLKYSGTGLLLGNTCFVNNRAKSNGGGIFMDGVSLRISGTGTYVNNTAGMVKSASNQATAGGVIYLRNSTLTIAGNATYCNNTAKSSGGVIFGRYSAISLDGRNTMIRNCAGQHGGAIALKSCSLRINSKVVNSTPSSLKRLIFENNNVNYSGGALYAAESHLELCGVTNFVDNVASFGGGLHAVRTGLLLNGSHDFRNNSASNGGGIALESYVNDAFLSISHISFLSFVNNHAQDHGGAVFVSDTADYTCPPSGSIPERRCFLNFGDTNLPHVRLPYERSRNITECVGQVVFEGNIANDGGHTLFGGAMYNCRVDIRFENPCKYPGCREQTCYMSGIEAVAALTNSSVQELTRDPFNVMSDTYKVCICDSGKPNCKQSSSNYSIFPGETITVSVSIVGKHELTTLIANVIQAQINDSKRVWLDKRQDTQSVNDTCSNLEYTLFASAITPAKLTLSVEGPCHSPGISHHIYMRVLRCPFGFYSQSSSCVCERRLQKYTNSCHINVRAITRSGDYWIGFDHHSHGLILHPHCSFDYCKLETVSFTLNSTDLQCAHGRSGILCGACKSGFSLKLGSSQCSSCSDVFLLLFIPFAIAGFLLVVFLFICKVTVAAGTTSGLIFYANVLAVNKSVFFPAGETNILTVFIAWLNLDLGIETCFIDGMDMYTRTWLQFVFPFYIWLLVGIIVFVSCHSTSIARIIAPTNPVSVLATLFLLSYTKLLRTIITTLSFTTLDYPNDKSVTVWVLDGNIEYFKGKHILLFLAGLLAFLLLFLPYTLLLLFGQWIEAGSNHKLLSWVNKPIIKHFLDAYYAPYKNRHRYWTGLLLLFRFVLFVISAVVDINSPRDPTVNLLVLGITCAVLMVWVWNIASLYKVVYINLLESSFILNLTILALASYHVKVEGRNQAAVVYTSVSVAFVTFLGIITFHVVELIRESRVWRITILPKLKTLKQTVMHHEVLHDAIEMTAPPTAPPQPVPTTFIELREPLLESQH